MKLISVHALTPDEKLYSNITNCKGLMMLKHGTQLTDVLIDKLKKAGIYAVYVEDEFSEEMDIRAALSDETKLEVLNYASMLQISLLKGKKTDFSRTRKISRDIYDEVRSGVSKPINLINTYAVDSPVLLHSMNVATIVAAMTSRADIRHESAEYFVAAALFHDLLLSNMDEDSDPAHAEDMYLRMKDSVTVGPITYMAVAMHHEKFNGTGAPRGLTGDKIAEGAKYIAVADMYDNLVFGYCGYKRMTPYAAVEYMMSEAGKSLDPEIVDLFSKCVAVYPTGATVLLNNGLRATVMAQNDGMPTRPVVRIHRPGSDEVEIIDLMLEHTIFIDELYL